ncbi:MAG: hypothetical protein ACOYNX_11900 [Geothrix sp.]
MATHQLQAAAVRGEGGQDGALQHHADVAQEGVVLVLHFGEDSGGATSFGLAGSTGGGVIGAGATNGTTTVTSPTPFTMTPFISRYIKIRAQNDGSLGSSGYIELKGVKAFWQ